MSDLSKRAAIVAVFPTINFPAFDKSWRKISWSRRNPAIDDRLRVEDKTKPLLIEGMSSGRWVLLDYGDFIVHIFTEECRRFYGLERLWGDAPNITNRFLQESAPKANAPAR